MDISSKRSLFEKCAEDRVSKTSAGKFKWKFCHLVKNESSAMTFIRMKQNNGRRNKICFNLLPFSATINPFRAPSVIKQQREKKIWQTSQLTSWTDPFFKDFFSSSSVLEQQNVFLWKTKHFKVSYLWHNFCDHILDKEPLLNVWLKSKVEVGGKENCLHL